MRVWVGELARWFEHTLMRCFFGGFGNVVGVWRCGWWVPWARVFEWGVVTRMCLAGLIVLGYDGCKWLDKERFRPHRTSSGARRLYTGKRPHQVAVDRAIC